ncbi:MAG: hypothetical protein LBC91_04040, partial [Candidatus Accumulibacter sp.]|nr:hypothetical protein [Accumulibacter sp.]
MKFGRHDISRLWGSLLAAILMLALGLVAVLASRDRIDGARAAFSVARAERNDIDAKLRRMRD